jgi:hypothetical protein
MPCQPLSPEHGLNIVNRTLAVLHTVVNAAEHNTPGFKHYQCIPIPGVVFPAPTI